MRRHDVSAPVGDSLDRRFERGVFERLDLPAVVADEMVVMVAARVRRLEARDSVSQVDALDEAQVGHAVERAVDARDPDPSAARADAIVDLVRREAAVLLAEQLDDDAASASASAARFAEACERGLRPEHGDNDTRSQRRATVACMRALFLAVIALLVSGCAGGEEDSQRTVVASFYPLAWAAERVLVGSDAIDEVVNLAPPGAEPHDIELSPSDIETVRDAELVVYIGGGFQPALEDAIGERDATSLDVLYGDSDPHIWVDPVRFARSVAAVAHAQRDIELAGPTLRHLQRLDAEYRRGLADCDRRTIVTTHSAFSQLARRYGLTELSLAGRSPESEPGPRELEALVDDVRASGATTVFTEPLVSDGLAQTVAREADVEVAALDPIEGLSEERLAAGEDYLSVMRSNLVALRQALGCR